MKLSKLFALALLALSWNAAHAWPAGTTKEEIALLPPYCAYTQGSKVPGAYERMVARYGFGWAHMHHYCYALVHINRINRWSIGGGALSAAIHGAQMDIHYVLERTPPTFQWRPEMMVALSRLHLKADKPREAAETAMALIEEWPHVADGYTMQAEILIKLGKPAEAEQVLRKADEKVTDKERLQRLKSILPGR